MLRNVALKTLQDSRRAIVWWSLGLVGLVALMLAVFPSVRDAPGLSDLVEQYPEALKGFLAFGGVVDYSTGAGFLSIELYSLMVPLLFLVAAIGAGARAIAGEEEKGTLELLLANPVSRRLVVTEKFAALAAELAILGLVLWLAIVLGGPLVDLGISTAKVGAATLSAVLLALLFGAIALFAGCAWGHRSRAIGVAAALAVLAYFVNALAPLVDALEPFQKLSPYYWYAGGDPLREGLDPAHLALLAGVTTLFAVLAPLAFERRDVSN